jgi:stearoyl-CoA desaturase (delta-9 desaturase)
VKRFGLAFVRWFDSWAGVDESHDQVHGIDWARVLPFLGMHLACLAVLWVGVSPIAVGVAVAGYFLRMFAITAFYHRYFSHRTFRTSRVVQFLGGFLGAASTQRGPLWWAAHHRLHHRHSDEAPDVHSPVQHSFLTSHMGWFLDTANFRTRTEQIPDLMKFPELRLLDRFDVLAPIAYALACLLLGMGLQAWAPQLGTNGPQMLVWGFFMSTVALYHGTFTINSLAHRWGSRRYDTSDDSRNNLFLSLITMGEGWHNNHHFHPGSARQGFRWYEIDPSYYLLKLMEGHRLVHDVRGVPERVVRSGDR